MIAFIIWVVFNKCLSQHITGRYGVRNTGHMRFRESSFDIGEAVCVLGIVTEVSANGTFVKSVLPVSADSLSESYFAKHEWSDWDKKSWADLTATPCIIVSDAPKHNVSRDTTAA